jgi:hypothetical protein
MPMVRWIVLALGAALLGRGNLLLSGLIFAAGAGVSYVVSLRLHPRRVCRACGGTGRHRGAMFWWGGSSVHQVRREPTAPQVGRSVAVRGPWAAHLGRAGGEGRRAAAGRAAIERVLR